MDPSLPRPPSPQVKNEQPERSDFNVQVLIVPITVPGKKHSPGSENTVVQELQVLITELKERDKELNDRIAVCQRQILACEDDLQKILTLGEGCNLLNIEKEKRKDQLLQSVKSKQAQTDTESSRLRQIYLKQQHDLQFLRVSLESSQELRQKHEKEAHERSIGLAFSAPESNGETDAARTEGTSGICKERGTADVPKSRVQTTSEMCEVDNRLLLNASDSEEATSVHLNRPQKVVKVLAVPKEEEEMQDVASSSGELGSKVFCEANNMRPLRNREISDNGVESGAQQTFESSSPDYEHWLSNSSGVDLQGMFVLIQNTVTSGKTDNENKTWEERTGILFAQKCKASPAAVHESESNSSARSSIIKKDAWWKPVSDLEWLEIFKPRRRDGKDCSCLKAAEEIKRASSKSEKSVDLNSFHLDSLCLTSTQRAKRPQRRVKFSGEDFPLEINNLSVTNPADRCCSATVDQDTSSPISKRQHALAESRQMVADLELSAVLPMSPHCSPNSSSSINMRMKMFPTQT